MLAAAEKLSAPLVHTPSARWGRGRYGAKGTSNTISETVLSVKTSSFTVQAAVTVFVAERT